MSPGRPHTEEGLGKKGLINKHWVILQTSAYVQFKSNHKLGGGGGVTEKVQGCFNTWNINIYIYIYHCNLKTRDDRGVLSHVDNHVVHVVGMEATG